MNINIVSRTFFLCFYVSACSSYKSNTVNVENKLSHLDAEYVANVNISHLPESPEEGIAYAVKGAHPYEIRLKLINGTEFHHYFSPNGQLRKSDKFEGDQITTIEDLRQNH